ncbi:MAG: chemoreceptor glutamine deamidase CheD [Nitrospirae bacterium]|nr:chemoreceptor glutamine deamidase CheD [Nitrospirota bacterium]
MVDIDRDPFFQVRRFQDERFDQEVAIIMPGEYFVSRNSIIVYTVLGSCVSVCIRDTVTHIGGMNHFMLPVPKISREEDSWGESGRYGIYAMELLINDILKRGGRKERFEVKVFGGGKIYTGENDIGASNADWILKYLHKEGLSPVQTDMGDVFPRKIYYFSDSGRVLMKKIVRIKNDTIMRREHEYKENLQKTIQTEGDVTLF